MSTVAELTALAAQLDREQLHELRREIQWLQKRLLRPLRLQIGDVSYRLTLLDDAEWKWLRERSIAIEDESLYPPIEKRPRIPPQRLRFVELFTVVAHRSGAGVRDGDDWVHRETFFPFALDVCKGERTFAYLLELHNNHFAALWCKLRKIVPAHDYRIGGMSPYSPFSEEFSANEVLDFFDAFELSLTQSWRVLQPRLRQPFLRKAPRLQLVFGYCESTFFQEEYIHEADYQVACQRWSERVARAREVWRASCTAYL